MTAKTSASQPKVDVKWHVRKKVEGVGYVYLVVEPPSYAYRETPIAPPDGYPLYVARAILEYANTRNSGNGYEIVRD